MRKQTRILFWSLLTLFSLLTAPIVTQASEGTGGQVSTDGKISFYEEATEKPTEPSTPEGDKQEASPPETGDSSTKPKGNLPNTGELFRNYGLIGLLLLILLLFFLREKTKGDKG